MTSKRYIDDAWLNKAWRVLRDMLDVDAHLRKQMIQFLIDEGFWSKDLEWPSAIAKWNACLNPQKGEFFKLGEIWALMLRFQRPQLFLAMAEDLGYQVFELPTEARRQAVLERIATATVRAEQELAAARAALERIDAIAEEKPATVAGGNKVRPLFSNAVEATAVERVGCP